MSYLFRVNVVIKILLCFILAVSCFQSYAAIDNQLLRKLDMQRGLFADSYQSFDIDEQSIIYILQEDTTAITRGVAVLVADTGIPIVGSQGFAALSNELNKIGWVTILLPAPDVAFQPLNAQENVAPVDDVEAVADDTAAIPSSNSQEPNPASAPIDLDSSKSLVTTINDQAFIKHEQRLIALIQAAFEKSQEYPGFFLVISKGTSAAWLTKIYAEKTVDAPDAFVAISPFWPDRKHNQRLPYWIANTSMPVLDLYSGWDNGWAQMTTAQRKIASIKSLKLQYRQRELLGFSTSTHQSGYISKEIYGWISHMGW